MVAVCPGNGNQGKGWGNAEAARQSVAALEDVGGVIRRDNLTGTDFDDGVIRSQPHGRLDHVCVAVGNGFPE
jgi:hypothetical protein